MSRSGKRLEAFREVTKRKRDKPAAPEPWTWKDKLSVWGALAGLSIVILIPFLDQRIKYRQRIDRRIECWKVDYHLSDEQARQIRELELDHHKSESPLSASSNPTVGEVQAHNRRIADIMSETDGNRFLERESRHGWRR
jgi:hypothetical protein